MSLITVKMRGRMKRAVERLTNIILTVGGTIALLAASFGTAVAQSQGPGASGLSISPTRTELTLQPNDEQPINLTLKNITSGPIVATPEINDFEADNNTGNPKIIKSNVPLSTSIKTFINNLDSVPLSPGEQRNVIVTAKALKDVVPGAYYGLIAYKAVPGGNQALAPGSVALSATVSTIVLITVPGNIVDSVQLTGVHAYNKQSSGSLFTKPPTQTGVDIRNLGNGFAKPFGKVVITDTFGKQVYTYEVNNTDPRANVLPRSTRTFKNDIKNVSKPGRYTITANISYGTGSSILVGNKTFWYLPWWLIVVIIAILVLLAVLTYLAFRRFRGRHYRHGR